MSGMYQAKQPVSVIGPDGNANRVAGTTTGTTMAMQQAGLALLVPGAVAGRGVTKLVAAPNASAGMLAAADYTCDGVADEVQIQAALDDLTAFGGTVLLSEGTFTLEQPIFFNVDKLKLQGMGMGATTLKAANSVWVTVNDAIVQIYGSWAAVSDLTIDGNKANNTLASGMYGIYADGVASPLIQRVRVLNSAGVGLYVGSTTLNGIVRDCLVEGSTDYGFSVQAAAGQPSVVSGCTAKANTGAGFICSSGPVTVSDCQALSTVGAGFLLIGTAQAALTNCLAQSCSSNGFSVSGSTARVRFVGCRAISNTNNGFWTDGTQIQYVGCLASGTTAGPGFTNISSSSDLTYSGCSAMSNNPSGFSTSGARVSFTGCRAMNSTSYGWNVGYGVASLTGCFVYGAGTGDYGVHLADGARHIVHACRLQNIGRFGINVASAITNAQITNNNISDVSLETNGTYAHINVDGDRTHIAGNMLRDPAAGNRPGYGIYVSSASDNSFIGYNDTFGVGTSNEISDNSTTTRRIAKRQLNYVQATDVTVQMTAGSTWYDVLPSQTFRVDSANSVIEISFRGNISVGRGASLTQQVQTRSRLVIDAAGTPIYRSYGGETTETVGSMQNALNGGQPIKIVGLAVGNHTVKIQTWGGQPNTSVYCRPATQSHEGCSIQVMEYLR